MLVQIPIQVRILLNTFTLVIISKFYLLSTNLFKHFLFSVDYSAFEKMYVSFASSMGIVFNSTGYDIILKINQFNTMPGIQPILALSTLYGQYIPPYAVCREQIHIQSKQLPKLISSPNPNKIFICMLKFINLKNLLKNIFCL